MNSECKRLNDEMKKENSNVIYEVLQYSDIGKRENIIQEIADFYDQNWLGNKDFMHIPDAEQVQENYDNYPIIIAREKGKNEILGISTIKYDENTEQFTDPYFPVKDAKYFSITGILTNKDTNHRGMGKKIYEIAVNSVYEYNKEHPGTQLMCVVDCRNEHSLNALATAVDNINKSGRIGENKELPANIVGYYELRDETPDEKLLEAPTLVIEVGLNGIPKLDKKGVILEYRNNINQLSFEYLKEKLKRNNLKRRNFTSYKYNPFGKKENLYNSILTDLGCELSTHTTNTKIINIDPGCGKVIYTPLKHKPSIRYTKIKTNGTENGNDREPSKRNEESAKFAKRMQVNVIPKITVGQTEIPKNNCYEITTVPLGTEAHEL